MRTAMRACVMLIGLLASSRAAAAEDGKAVLGIGFDESGEQLRVSSTIEGSSAAKFVLPGDVLIAIDDIPVASRAVVRAVLAKRSPGEEVILDLDRASTRFKCAVILGGLAAPAPAPAPAASIESTSVHGAHVFSGIGPKNGAYGVAIGGAYFERFAFLQIDAAVPMSSLVALDAQVRTRIEANFFDLGARFSLIDKPTFALTARARLHLEYFEVDGRHVTIAGPSAGLAMSFGGGRVRGIAGADGVLLSYGKARGESVFEYLGHALRPYVGVEVAVADEVGLFATAEIRSVKIVETERSNVLGLSSGVAF